jgi:diguanylate cyclase (GGDEF)-like protein
VRRVPAEPAELEIENSIIESEFRLVFDAAPVPLWIDDYSGMHALFADLRRRGVTDLEAHIRAHPSVIDEAVGLIRILDVNTAALRLLKAESVEALIHRSDDVFGTEMRRGFGRELAVLWTGELTIEIETVNVALDGTPVDVLLRRGALPGFENSWERVLVSTMDISERKRQERALALSEARATALFEHSPVSLWIEDFSEVKDQLDGLRAAGVSDIRRHIAEHPEFVQHCMSLIKVVDVNRRTLELYRASSKDELIERLDEVFRGEMRDHFLEDLVQMWAGRPRQEAEGVNYDLTGEPIDIHLQWTVLPGHEERWDRALVSVTDITARKRADAYLRYLGSHDPLTGLFNRSHFDETVKTIQAGGYRVLSVVIADLNGLKQANDDHGHAAGDMLIRRAGEVLSEAVDGGDIAARIGGDEFALLLPGRGEFAVGALVKRIRSLIEVNNRFYRGPTLSIAIGTSTAHDGQPLAKALRLADTRMYGDKAGVPNRRSVGRGRRGSDD